MTEHSLPERGDIAKKRQGLPTEMTPEDAAVVRDYLRPERALRWKELPLAGRRRPDARADDDLPDDLRFGDYWRTNGIWTAYIPGGPVGALPNHRVEEHEDGTISVLPPGNSIVGHNFHGWIRNGVWTSS